MPEPSESIMVELGGRRRSVPLSLRIGCGGILALAFLFVVALKPYTDYLWYAEDIGRPEVFTLAYSTRGLLFGIVFAVATALYAFSFLKALGVTMVYIRRPETMGEAVAARAIAWVQANGPAVVKSAALVFALFAALGISGEWQTWLLFLNAQSFGLKDPTFGMDVGFFVFSLPWWTAVSNFAFSLFFIGLLGTFAIYFGLEFIASLGKIEVSKPFVRMHLSLLGVGLLLSGAARLWLGRYEIGYLSNPLFTGGGYSEQAKLPIQAALSIALLLVAAVVLWNARSGKPYIATAWAAGIWAAAYGLGMWVYPTIVQKFTVEPNKINAESPYAERAMDMTRFAYGLDQIEARETSAQPRPTDEELVHAKSTIDNMRLWDPDVLRETIEPIQSLRPYYRFHDVDVDRYTLDGKQTLVMLSPRDVELDGLTPGARSWVNMRLQYTHGYGVVMSAVNGATSEGRPVFLVKDFPPKTPPGLTIERPQLYFSDIRDEFGQRIDQYAIVGTRVEEFDYPSEGDAVYGKWEEPRGVPVSGILARAAFSALLGDGNLLVSTNIDAKSRLVFRRNVLERARLVYPFLRFDQDPYIVVFNGLLVWILDAYTATDRIPYSSMAGSGDSRLNYIRNSVKVTIDAYSGEMHGYVMAPEDPILRAYRRIYPKLFEDKTAVPEGLNRHFRYPEDLFMLQAGTLTQYHVRTPTSFLNNDDAWDIPVERGSVGAGVQMKAYYVQIQLPEEAQDRFFLILPMTPRQKGNMSGWLAAECDPENYGKLLLYRYPKNSNTPGPAQMESLFNQDREIANLNKLLNSEQSEIVQGNLLVIPIGKSVLYVKPLFLKSLSRGIQPIPELKKVILATSDKIVVADTYEQALDRLFGGAPPAVTIPDRPAVEPSAPSADTGVKAGIREALELSRQADAALRAGDFAMFGDLQKRLRAKLELLAK